MCVRKTGKFHPGLSKINCRIGSLVTRNWVAGDHNRRERVKQMTASSSNMQLKEFVTVVNNTVKQNFITLSPTSFEHLSV